MFSYRWNCNQKISKPRAFLCEIAAQTAVGNENELKMKNDEARNEADRQRQLETTPPWRTGMHSPREVEKRKREVWGQRLRRRQRRSQRKRIGRIRAQVFIHVKLVYKWTERKLFKRCVQEFTSQWEGLHKSCSLSVCWSRGGTSGPSVRRAREFGWAAGRGLRDSLGLDGSESLLSMLALPLTSLMRGKDFAMSSRLLTKDCVV